jgi:hypothetical protein
MKNERVVVGMCGFTAEFPDSVFEFVHWQWVDGFEFEVRFEVGQQSLGAQ